MRERAPTPFRRASRLIGLAADLSRFCEQHDQRDLAGGLTHDEVHEVERQLAAAREWVRQLIYASRGKPSPASPSTRQMEAAAISEEEDEQDEAAMHRHRVEGVMPMSTDAEVHVFPYSRNRGMINRVARQMAKRPSIDDAEQELAIILEIVGERLELFGVAEDMIEVECHRLARAAWGRWQQLQREAGAA